MAMFMSSKPGMRRLVDRDDEGKVPVLRDDENILFTFPNIEFSFTSSDAIGNGTLFVTNQRFVWLSVSCAYDFDVRFVMLHAISKDVATYPKPCLYCQLDVEQEQCGEENDDEEGEPDECFFAPGCVDGDIDTVLMSIFDAFSQAAQLNPDPEEEEGEGEGMMQYSTDDFIYNEEEVAAGVQQAQLADWESKFQLPAGTVVEDTEVPAAKVPKTEEA